MSNLSKEACLSVRYTNHCIRAMVSSTLNKAGFSSSSIMSVTGHRNVQNLTHYIKPSEQEWKQLSSHLSYGSSSSLVNKTTKDTDLLSLGTNSPSFQQNRCDIQVKSTVNSNITKSVDVSHSGNMTQFQLFSGNISSSTINVYCSANSFEK